MKLNDYIAASGDRLGVTVVGVCMLASLTALALWFSSELTAAHSESIAGPQTTRVVQTSAVGVYADWLPVEPG